MPDLGVKYRRGWTVAAASLAAVLWLLQLSFCARLGEALPLHQHVARISADEQGMWSRAYVLPVHLEDPSKPLVVGIVVYRLKSLFVSRETGGVCIVDDQTQRLVSRRVALLKFSAMSH